MRRSLGKPAQLAREAVFNDAVGKLMVVLGCTSVALDVLGREYTVESTFGALRVLPLGTWVACRFRDDDHLRRAANELGSNPFSGKWNVHFEDGMSLDERLQRVVIHLGRAVVFTDGQRAGALALREAIQRWGDRGQIEIVKGGEEYRVGELFTRMGVVTFRVRGRGATWVEAFINADHKRSSKTVEVV